MLSKKIMIFIPYFGNLDSKGYFQRFLDSCKNNGSFTWMIFTDDRTGYEYPSNVIVEYIEFSAFCKLIQKKFDFQIKIDAPYKLCDFKPAYGDIFRERLEGYDWWGFGDTDLIWGKADHFITDQMLDKYDQLYSRGHLTLSKCTENMLTLYKDEDGVGLYKVIFSSSKHYAFDELHKAGGWREIVKRNNIKLYDKLDFADIAKVNRFCVFRFELAQVELKKDEKNKHLSVFRWDDTGLKRFFYRDGKQFEEEYLYIHLQRRVLNDKIPSRKAYFIVPNRIVKGKNVTLLKSFCLHCSFSNLSSGIYMLELRLKEFCIKITNKIKSL